MFSPILRQTRRVITEKAEKGCDTPVKRSADALRDGRRRPPWSAGTSHGAGENTEGTGENTYRAPAFHACRKRTVLRPFDADHAARTDVPRPPWGMPILSRKRGREQERWPRTGKTAAVVDHGRSNGNPTMGTSS